MFKKYSGFIWAGAALLVLLISSMGKDPQSTGVEFSPNMYYPVGYEPMSQIEKHPINPLGMNMRKPVDGTVSRRNYQTTFNTGNDSAKVDLMVYNIKADDMAGSETRLTNPVPMTEISMKEGQELYEKFCLHCHGEGGKGDGPVAKMYKGVPVYSSDALKDLNDGHIYHTITHGKGRMWPHGSQISPVDRWKIVQYVHKLQKS